MGGLVGDLRFAVRSLLSTPAVTFAALLTFTLGIGATTAIFSVANGLLLRPLPVRDPQQLVTITSDFALRYGFQAGVGWNHAMWERLQQRAGAFDGAFAWTVQQLDLSDGGEMQPVTVVFASGEVFSTLGVQAIRGRTFSRDDDVRGGGSSGPVAVISYDLWQRRFQGDASAVGTRLTLDRTPLTIAGVMPAGFRGVDVGQPFEVVVPFGAEPLIRRRQSVVTNPRALTLTVMLRLKAGQSLESATAALRTMQADIIGPDAPQFLQEPFVLVPAATGVSDRSRLRQQYQYPLVILGIVSGLVLLIVCLNIANLLLSRAAERRPQLSIRLALGAPRSRIARQALAEAIALGIAGLAGGVLCAAWASRVLVTQLPRAQGAVSLDVPIDWSVFVFITALASIAVVLFGTAPAWYATRVHPIEAMGQAGRGAVARRTSAITSGLVVAQVALSIVLVAAAVLFARTANRLAHVALGFDPAGLIALSVTSPRTDANPDPTASAMLAERLVERLGAVPGVARVAGSVWNPVGTGAGGLLVDVTGRRATLRRPEAFNFVTPGWFSTYTTALRSGRDFEIGDGPSAARVAIVNETFRRTSEADRVSLGSTIKAGPCGRDGCTVIGIVDDTVYGQSLRDSPPPIVYVPMAQSAGLGPDTRTVRVTVRASGDAATLRSSLAAAIREVNPALTFSFSRVDDEVREALAPERLVALLAIFFGAIGLLLAGVGLYGISAHTIAGRRAEIGIRLALGGPPAVVVREVLTRIALLVGAGMLAGVGVALWLSRFVAPLLYGVTPHDTPTLIAAPLILAATAIVAAWIPALRATRVDPAEVLRAQ